MMPPDEADIANDYAMRDIEMRIAEVRNRPRIEAPELCIECEEPNLPPRRALGLPRCLECAQLAEFRARQWAR